MKLVLIRSFFTCPIRYPEVGVTTAMRDRDHEEQRWNYNYESETALAG